MAKTLSITAYADDGFPEKPKIHREPTEANIVAAILRFLNKLPNTYARKVHGSIVNAGFPDIVGCYKGLMLALEVKKPSTVHDTSAIQKVELQKWHNAGAIAGVVTSADDVAKLLRTYHQQHGGSVDW